MSGLLDQAGLTAGSGLSNGAGLYKWGNYNPFDPTDLDPYLLFDTAAGSMIGTLENPTLDLDPSNQETLDVITATRASVATRTLPDGTIALAEQDTVRVDHTQGAELTPTKFQRTRFTDFSSGWLNSGVSTVSDTDLFQGQVAKRFTVTGNGVYYAYTPVESGRQYTASFYARLISGSNSQLYFFNNSSVPVYTPISVTSEWQRFTTTVTSTGTSINSGIINSAGTDPVAVEISQPQVEEGTTASDFVANTTGSPKFIASATFGPRVPMILVEPSSENLVDYSEDFTQSTWNKTNVSITANAATAPDGTETASKVILDSSNLFHFLQKSITLGAESYSFSAYLKAATATTASFFLSQSGNNGAVFDLQAGSVVSVSGTGNTASIEDAGNGWFRCVITNDGSSDLDNNIRIGVASGAISSFQGNGTDSILVWGAQVETGSVATSYIPTSGGNAAARTRAADDLVISGSAFSFYNQSEGTFYVESELQRETEVGFQPFLFDADNGDANRVLLYNETAGDVLGLVKAAGSGYEINLGTHPAVNTLSRTAFSYISNNLQGSKDGNSITPVTTATIPTTISRLNVGSHYTKAENLYLNGRIRRLIFWPTHSSRL